MKAFLKCGFGLALGIATPLTLLAQELQWRPTGGSTGSGAPSIGLSRPTPLSDPAPLTISPLKPIIRAQNSEEKPLPLGPLGDGKNPAPAPIAQAPTGQTPTAQAPTAGGQPQPKTGEFIAPLPRPTTAKPPPPAVMPQGDCGPERCGLFGCGILECKSLFGHGGWFSHIWEPGCWTMNPCCDRPCAWISADYLYWTMKNGSFPPLVTTSPAGTPVANAAGQPVAGVLGLGTTTTVLDRFNDPWRSGIRISGGFYFHNDGCWGLDASFWSLGSWSQTFGAGGNGNPIVARPFTDVGPVNPGPGAELVAFPGVVNGTVTVVNQHSLWGADVDLRRKLWCGPRGFVDLLVGYRYLWFSEGLDITENLTPLGPGGAPLGTNIVSDRFHTSNAFNGAQFGLAGEWRIHQSRWTLAGTLKVAVGDMRQTVDIQGNQVFNIPPIAPSVQNGGILALPTNIGKVQQDRFAVIPELGLKVGYDLTPHLRLYAGYDFMYVSSVVRPGNQIDLTINRSQIPNALGPQPLVGTPRPAPQFNTTDFWVQGFSAGLLWRY